MVQDFVSMRQVVLFKMFFAQTLLKCTLIFSSI